MSKQDLLEILDKEERYKEEKIEIPKLKFDPIKRIASIFEKADTYLDFVRLKGSLENNLMASYLVENLETDIVNTYLRSGRSGLIQKIVMVDLAAGVNGNYNYNVSEDFKKLSTRIAGDIYYDFFSTLYESFYLKPKNREKKRQKKKEKKIKQEPEQNDSDLFLYFKGTDLDSLIAASNFVEHLEGMEERLVYCNNIADVKYLAGVKVYYDLIKSPKIKNELMMQISNPDCSIKDVFIYSVLKFHQDFFNEIEKEKGVEK